MSTEDVIPSIVSFLRSKLVEHKVAAPDLGIICGSGLGGLASTLSDAFVVKYEGHAGELVFGSLGGKNVVCMKGRFHFYEGYTPAQVGLPVRVMAALGIKALVVTNAAGGVNPEYNVGDVMIIEGEISAAGLAGLHPLVGRNDDRFGPRFPAVSPVFGKDLQALVTAANDTLGGKLVVRKGVYYGVSGPSYETPHEIAMIRKLGGDAVGMSTVFEILVAAHAGVQVLGLSIITNRCMGPDDDVPAPTHEEVLHAINKAGHAVEALVSQVVGSMDLSKAPRSIAYEHFLKLDSEAVVVQSPAPALAQKELLSAEELTNRVLNLEAALKDRKPCPYKVHSSILIPVLFGTGALMSLLVSKLLKNK